MHRDISHCFSHRFGCLGRVALGLEDDTDSSVGMYITIDRIVLVAFDQCCPSDDKVFTADRNDR